MFDRRFAFAVSSSLLLAGLLPLRAGAELLAHYKLDEASGVLHDTGAAPAVDTTNQLKDAKDYAQPGVPAGKYGEITASDDQPRCSSHRFTCRPPMD